MTLQNGVNHASMVFIKLWQVKFLPHIPLIKAVILCLLYAYIHTGASLAPLISFISNWYYYLSSCQEASQCIKPMHSNIYKHSQTFIMQAHCLHPFHVIHAHGHIRLPDPPPKDIVAILMTSLIETLNTELPSQLRACSHIILLSMYTHICRCISCTPFTLIF
jgi:hypothetical protein